MNHIRKRQQWFTAFFIEKQFRIYRHLTIWGYLLFTEILCHKAVNVYTGNVDEYRLVARLTMFVAMVYINMYLLVPKLLYRGRFFTYLILTIITVIGSLLAFEIIFGYFFNQFRILNSKTDSIFDSLDDVNMIAAGILASTAIKLFQKWKTDTTRMHELEKSALQVELQELKNQVNPHFLFNMLNNVNVLTLKNPEKASTIIMKLSEFLRYQLYETNRHLVPISSEISFLEDFFELESIRRDEFYFSISNQIPDEQIQTKLPPNLFLIFAENAVKHSSDPEGPSNVSLHFSCTNGLLQFRCINSKPSVPAYTSVNGLGLANVTRRLSLIYGDNYKLHIDDQPDEFKINLSMPL